MPGVCLRRTNIVLAALSIMAAAGILTVVGGTDSSLLESLSLKPPTATDEGMFTPSSSSRLTASSIIRSEAQTMASKSRDGTRPRVCMISSRACLPSPHGYGLDTRSGSYCTPQSLTASQ